MMIYNTLSLPHLNYGILLWGAKVKKDQKLHLLQKKSMTIITSQHYRSHSEPIFKNLGLLMVDPTLPILYGHYKILLQYDEWTSTG